MPFFKPCTSRVQAHVLQVTSKLKDRINFILKGKSLHPDFISCRYYSYRLSCTGSIFEYKVRPGCLLQHQQVLSVLVRLVLNVGAPDWSLDQVDSADTLSALKKFELCTTKVPDFRTYPYQNPIRMKYEQQTLRAQPYFRSAQTVCLR